jgi:hypothetical protein
MQIITIVHIVCHLVSEESLYAQYLSVKTEGL